MSNTVTEKMNPSQVAVIREEECIGCTKCLNVCPTDAIIGSHKKMHTVVTDACIGCELCLEPCPIDCIDFVTAPPRAIQEEQTQYDVWHTRHQAKLTRLAAQNKRKTESPPTPSFTAALSATERQAAIAAAVLRARQRKLTPHE